MSDERIPIPPFGKSVVYFERALADAEREENPERTLFAQFTKFEVVLIQFALMWLGRLYGAEASGRLIDKLHDLIVAQEFCDCPNCKRKRAEGDTMRREIRIQEEFGVYRIVAPSANVDVTSGSLEGAFIKAAGADPAGVDALHIHSTFEAAEVLESLLGPKTDSAHAGAQS